MPRVKKSGDGAIYPIVVAEPDSADTETRAALNRQSRSKRATRTPIRGVLIPVRPPEPFIERVARHEEKLLEILVRNGQSTLADRHVAAQHGSRAASVLETYLPELPEGPLSGEALYACDALRAIRAFHEARWHLAPDLYPDWPPPSGGPMSFRLLPLAEGWPSRMAEACLVLGALLERLDVLPHEPSAARGTQNRERTRAGGLMIHEKHEATHNRWREIRDRSKLKGRALARHVAALTGDDAEAIRSYFQRQAKKVGA